MSGVAVRMHVAELVAPALPEGWTTYHGPPEVASLPAAVVTMRSPYREAGTACAELIRLRVWLLEARSSGLEGLDGLDELTDPVRAALLTDPTIVIPSLLEELGMPPPVGGVEVYGAAIDLEIYAPWEG